MYWDTTPPRGRTRLPALLTGETSPTTNALLHKDRSVLIPVHICARHMMCTTGEESECVGHEG